MSWFRRTPNMTPAETAELRRLLDDWRKAAVNCYPSSAPLFLCNALSHRHPDHRHLRKAARLRDSALRLSDHRLRVSRLTSAVQQLQQPGNW